MVRSLGRDHLSAKILVMKVSSRIMNLQGGGI